MQYDAEYETKLRRQLEAAVADKLDEQRVRLTAKFADERVQLGDEYRRTCDSNAAEIKTLRDKLSAAERDYNALRLERAELEVRATRGENELKEKLLAAERLAAESAQRARAEANELAELRVKCDEKERRLETAERALVAAQTEVTRLEASNEQLVKLGDELRGQCAALRSSNEQQAKQLELAQQLSAAARTEAKARDDDELQKAIEQLEKRFEDDYAQFMDKHKEAMLRTLADKSQESARDKQALVELYEAKLAALDHELQLLQRQLKEAKAAAASASTAVAALEKERDREVKRLAAVEMALAAAKARPVTSDSGVQTDEVEEDTAHEEQVSTLQAKIGALEDLIANTDAHFEIELDKLRVELDDEYQLKHQRLQRQLDEMRVDYEHMAAAVNQKNATAAAAVSDDASSDKEAAAKANKSSLVSNKIQSRKNTL